MALSKSTLEHLLEAEPHIRAAIKSAAGNEKPLVVKSLGYSYEYGFFTKTMDLLWI